MLKGAKRQQGQVTVEMAVLFGVVVAALVALSIYFQRGVQGGVRSNADSIGSQFSATGAWNQTTNTNQTTNETATQVTTTQDQDLSYSQSMN